MKNGSNLSQCIICWLHKNAIIYVHKLHFLKWPLLLSSDLTLYVKFGNIHIMHTLMPTQTLETTVSDQVLVNIALVHLQTGRVTIG